MKKLFIYGFIALFNAVGLANGASNACINRRLARLTGHVAAVPTTLAKKLAVAKINAEIQPASHDLAQADVDHIDSIIDSLVVEKTIFDCIREKDFEGLKKIARKPGFDVNAREGKDGKGLTALMCAALDNNLAYARFLVEKCGANVTSTDLGFTAAYYAQWAGHNEVYLYLVFCCYLQHQAQAVHYVARTVSALVSRL